MKSFFLFLGHFLPKRQEKPLLQWSHYLALLFIISLFLRSSPAVSNGLFGLFCLISFFHRQPDNTDIPEKKFAAVYWLPALAYLLPQLWSICWNPPINNGLQALLKYAPLSVCFLAFWRNQLSPDALRKILLFFAFTTFVCSIAGFIWAIRLCGQHHDTGYLYNDNLSSPLYDKQAVYYGIYVNLSIFIFISAIRRPIPGFEKRNWMKAAVLFLVLIGFLLASRMALFCLLVVLGTYLFQSIITKKKWAELGLLLFGIGIGGILLYKFQPKSLNRLNGLFQTEYRFDNQERETHFNETFDENKWNSTNTRAAIWDCAKSLIQEHPWTGVGIGNKKQVLLERYRENNFTLGLRTEKNTHSQYLDIIMYSGIPFGIIFILGFILYPLYRSFRSKSLVCLVFIFTLGFCFLTENLFDRYQGLFLIAFFYPLLLTLSLRKPVTPL